MVSLMVGPAPVSCMPKSMNPGGEEIRYVDVTSLYPTVNKYDVYPVGHTTVLTNAVEDIG